MQTEVLYTGHDGRQNGRTACSYTKDLPDGNYTSEMEGFRMNKFEIVKGEQSSSETDVPLFRYAEVLLMKAECLLRSGKTRSRPLGHGSPQTGHSKTIPNSLIVTDAQLQENSSYQYGYVEHYTVTDKGERRTSSDSVECMTNWAVESAWEMHRQTRRHPIRCVYTKKLALA
ncbi:MAG: RagB/SusD family nutrient uptake outer membrane protein [Parabacteroides merdae]